MTLEYHISPSSVTENCKIFLYEPQLDGSLAQVAVLPITAPYITAQTITFTGLDYITHKGKMIGDTTGVIYHDFNVIPSKDVIHIFDYIRFVIGDGQSGTPVNGTIAYTNSAMNGLTDSDYTVSVSGIGFLFEGIHITNNPSGGFTLLGGAIFSTSDQYLIQRKPTAVTNPVNDSVVGKQWGETVLLADLYVDVSSVVSYTPAHLRKLIRLAGPNANYKFTAASVPPAGYPFRITNFGTYGSDLSAPRVTFENALCKYGNSTLTHAFIPFGQVAEVVWDGVQWNLTMSQPLLQTIPTFYTGSVDIGDIGPDRFVNVTFPNQGTSNYFVCVTLVSHGNPFADNDICFCVKTKSNTGFVLLLSDIGGLVQGLTAEYMLIIT